MRVAGVAVVAVEGKEEAGEEVEAKEEARWSVSCPAATVWPR